MDKKTCTEKELAHPKKTGCQPQVVQWLPTDRQPPGRGRWTLSGWFEEHSWYLFGIQEVETTWAGEVAWRWPSVCLSPNGNFGGGVWELCFQRVGKLNGNFFVGDHKQVSNWKLDNLEGEIPKVKAKETNPSKNSCRMILGFWKTRMGFPLTPSPYLPICQLATAVAGQLASFGFGPKALFLLLGSVSAEEKSVPTAAEDPTAEEDLLEPASKRLRTDAVEVRKVCQEVWGSLVNSPPKKLMEIDWFSSDSMEFEGDVNGSWKDR